ncbi:MAG: hypothetical protein HQL18_01210 [Candidatus Omnitrophica bacterium]|nr:hypothetical protein [Candidatus Omnitrophota bacterium]
MKIERVGSRQYRVSRGTGNVFCFLLFAYCLLVVAGCATTKPAPTGSAATVDQKFQAVAVDIYKNEDSRSAAQKILGVTNDKPVIKYSPVTGKHYSGDLEFDPETGAKLKVVEE